MANEKVLNTRIQLKYDSYSNWVANNTALRAGEIAIAYLTTAEAVKPGEGDTQHPVLFKVGPGNFNDLPWASALAADVHSWAKKTESEFAAWVKTLVTVADIDAYSKDEVDAKFTANSTADQKYAKDYADSLAENYDAAGTAQNLINDLDVTDTAVTGKYVSAVSETDGKISVTREDLPTYTLATGSANGTVAFNGEDVAGKGLGSAAYTDSTAYDAAGAASEVNNALEAYKILNDAAVSAADAKGAQGITDAAAALAKANEKTTMAEVEAKDYATKAQAQAMADGKDAAIEAAQKAGDDAQNAVDALAEKVGDVAEDKTVVEMIADAQAAATYDDTQIKADIKANGDAIKAIQDDYLTSVEEKTLQDQITANANAIELLTNGVSAEEVDGVNDLIQYVKEHGTEVTGMKADITANADAIDALEELVGDKKVSEAIAEAVEACKTDASNKDAVVLAEITAHANNGDIHVTTADKATWNAAVQTVTAGTGLKATKTGTDVEIDFDDEVVFIFNCGTSV